MTFVELCIEYIVYKCIHTISSIKIIIDSNFNFLLPIQQKKTILKKQSLFESF